jgi:GcrA cell cycle regulator
MQHFWTDDRIAELKRLFEKGLSCSQIAAELGHVTRNAVIGKLNRLGLGKGPTASSARIAALRPTQPREPKPRLKPRFPPLSVVSTDEPALPPDVCPNRISLLDAMEGHCRWPAADDGSASMVCGDDKFPGHAWCARHCRVAYEPRRQPINVKPFRRVREAV